MKRTLFILGMTALLAACGNDDKKDTSTAGGEKQTETKLSPEAERGETLITQNDCLTCHKIEDRLNGPSYREVANKYAGQAGIEDTLAAHIIQGHVGNWGQMPMTAHPNLSKEDAKAMVTYILSLKQ